MNEAKNPGLLPLETFYLGVIAQVLESEKLSAVLQDLGAGKGRLYAIKEGSTAPVAVIQFEFKDQSVAVGIQHRNGAAFAHDYKLVEGLDGFLPEMVKVLQSNLLASNVAPRKADKMAGPAARRAA